MVHAGLQLIVTEEKCPRQDQHLDNTDGFSCALGLDPVNFLNVVLSPDKKELIQYRFGDLVSWTNSVSSRICIDNVLRLACVQVIHAGPEQCGPKKSVLDSKPAMCGFEASQGSSAMGKCRCTDIFSCPATVYGAHSNVMLTALGRSDDRCAISVGPAFGAP